jgi:hypothetical protein
MRIMPKLPIALAMAVIAAMPLDVAGKPYLPAARAARTQTPCPHLDQLLALVRRNGQRLVARQIGGGDIVGLFEHLAVDLPARFVRADAAVIVHAPRAQGQAIIVLFARGCVLAALRLPAGDAIGALKRITGQEI